MTTEQIIDRILVNTELSCEYLHPYIIISDSSFTPEEIAEALDIDPALCCYNLNGNIRITCE